MDNMHTCISSFHEKILAGSVVFLLAVGHRVRAEKGRAYALLFTPISTRKTTELNETHREREYSLSLLTISLSFLQSTRASVMYTATTKVRGLSEIPS